MNHERNGLPRELAAKVAAAEQKDRRIAFLLALAGVAFALCIVFLPFLLVERLWTVPGLARGLFLLVALGGMGWFVGKWLAHRVRCLRDPFFTIRRVEKHYPDLGDSLQGVIELSGDARARQGISESLRQAAVRQVTQRCEPLEFTEAIPTSRLWTYTKRAAAILVLLVGFGIWQPELVRNALARFVQPWADIPRYTFARLSPLPSSIRVPRGEPFTVKVQVAGDSRWSPERLRFRLGGSDTKSCSMETGEAMLELPGITQTAKLQVRLGDTKAAMQVEPVPRPALLELVGTVAFPEYLGRPPEEVECARQRPRLVAGSRVSLRGTTLNPLRTAWFDDGDAKQTFTVDARSFHSVDLPVEDLVSGMLHWRDEFGLTPTEPYKVEMEVVPDNPPGVQLRSSSRVAAMLEREVLDFSPQATDDFGVKAVEVAWNVFPADKPEASPVKSGRREVGKGAPDMTEWTGDFAFSPQRLGIPAGSRVILRAKAVDYRPGRAFSESQPVVVFVLTPQDHARLVQNQLEALRNRMEEAALREAEQLFTNEQLSKLTPEQLRLPENQKKLDRQKDLENKSVEDWKRLNEEAAKLLAEAARNDEFPNDVLKEWAQTMEAVQQVSSELLPQAAGALAQASQSPNQRKENIQKAIEAQRKALEALKKAAQDMGESLEQFAVLNMAARLRALADRERTMGGALQELFPKTIGMGPDDLTPLLANRVKGLEESQGIVQKLAFEVKFDVGRYMENTGIEKYGKVAEAMEKVKLTEEFPKAGRSIAANKLAEAIGEVQRWAKAFDEWATILDDKKDGGGGGGGGDCQMSEEAIEFMLAILRAAQGQEQLRRDTGALDTEKDQTQDYAAQAERLSVAESELSRTVGELAKKLRPSEARNIVENAEGLMEQVAITMREPATGKEVQADMASAVEMLLSLFESNCKGGKCKSAGMMAMLAQKMGFNVGMGAGASGGGSRAGGPFGGSGGTVTGGAGSGGSAARGGDSVTDVAPAEFPAEYRGLLETFFQKVEAANE
jgi:hypothetical protein